MKIIYFAAVRDRVGTAEEEVRLERPVTVREFHESRLKGRLRGVEFGRLLFAVNGEMADGAAVLHDGDVLAVMSPLSGGVALARIQREDFDMAAETRLCIGAGNGAGGIAAFTGVVRDNAKGKRIVKMELTCYPGMAEKELEKVRAEAAEKCGALNVTVVHRIGELRPGDRIVGIVAVAEHRDQAFDACRYAIAELKKRVPIWKKEFTEDGGYWVEGL